MLVIPNYLKPFYIYSFVSYHSCASILTQKGNEGNEHPIAFMSAPLKYVEWRYHNIEKQVYALIRGVKKFKHYILSNKLFSIVLDPTMKTLLIQNEMGERRTKWVTLLQEYDMEIQPMKLVRGQELTQTIVETTAEVGPELIVQQYQFEDVSLGEWYDDIIYYLLNHKCPPRLQGV